MMSEKALISGSIQRNREALEELYRRYAPPLLGICLRYCGIRADAEDVLHDAFIKILSNLGRFADRPDGSFEGWLKRITVNTALNFLRSRSKHSMITDTGWTENIAEDSREEETSFLELAEGMEKEALLQMICGLPEGYRTVFNMYVFEEFSHKEIAEQLRCSESTSKTQLFKARALLRKRVTEVLSSQQMEK